MSKGGTSEVQRVEEIIICLPEYFKLLIWEDEFVRCPCKHLEELLLQFKYFMMGGT